MLKEADLSKKCAKGGRFDSSLTRSNVKTREKMSQIGAKNEQDRGSSHPLAYLLLVPEQDDAMKDQGGR